MRGHSTTFSQLISRVMDRPLEFLFLSLATILLILLLRVIMDRVVLYTMGVHSMAAASKPLRISDVDIYLHDVAHPVSYWTERGGRPYQEDRYDARTAVLSRSYRRHSATDSRCGSTTDLAATGGASENGRNQLHSSGRLNESNGSNNGDDRIAFISSDGSSSSSRSGRGEDNRENNSSSSSRADASEAGVARMRASIYGVFDGHGGVLASEFCKRHLLEYVVEALNDCDSSDDGGDGASHSGSGTSTLNYNSETMGGGGHSSSTAGGSVIGSSLSRGTVSAAEHDSVRRAMSTAFHRLNDAYCAACGMKSMTTGSTAVVAMLHGDRIIVAHVGDSRCILVQRGGRVVPLTQDHKPNREDERARIRSLGGKVTHHRHSRLYRVEGMLAVSRAIGDIKLSPYVVCEPEVCVRPWTGCGFPSALVDNGGAGAVADRGASVAAGQRYGGDAASNSDRNTRRTLLAAAASGGASDDLFLVMASDGLWDVMSDAEVGRFVYRRYLKTATTAGAGSTMNGSASADYTSGHNSNRGLSGTRTPDGSAVGADSVHASILSSYSSHKQFVTIAKQLCEEAIILGSSDNVTVQVIDLTQCRLQQPADEAESSKARRSGHK